MRAAEAAERSSGSSCGFEKMLWLPRRPKSHVIGSAWSLVQVHIADHQSGFAISEVEMMHYSLYIMRCLQCLVLMSLVCRFDDI